jgi:hypothetical protein
MKLALEILGGLVLLGGFVTVLAWTQSRIDRALEPSRRAGVGFFDAEPGPPEPPAGIIVPREPTQLDQLDALRHIAAAAPYGATKRKPFSCLAQHPDGWICGRTKDHVGAHYPTFGDTVRDNLPLDFMWPQSGPLPVPSPVGAKTALHVAPGGPNAAPPLTMVSPENVPNRQRRIK